MTLPALITVKGLIRDQDGPVSGRIVFARSAILFPASTSDQNLLIPDEVEVTVGADGVFSQALYASNDPAASPTGFTWEVRPHFPNWRTPFSIVVPYDAAGGQINLNQLAPVPANGTGALYALANHTHAGGGGGAVTSVNSRTGDVSLVATDVTDSTTLGRTLMKVADAAAARTAIDFTEAVQDTVGAMVVAGTNVTATYNDTDGTLTLSAAGGGGGTTITYAGARVSTGDLSTTNDAAFTLVSGLSMSIAAVAGDHVELDISGLFDMSNSTTEFFDLGIVVSGSVVRYSSSGTNTPAVEGDPSMYPVSGARFVPRTVSWNITVQSGDLSGGNIAIQFAHKGGGSAKILASASYPLRWQLKNLHQ